MPASGDIKTYPTLFGDLSSFDKRITQLEMANSEIGSPQIGGLLAEFYDSQSLTGHLLERNVKSSLNFNNYSPTGESPVPPYSVRFTGWILPEFTETYTFYSTSTDGVKIIVNDTIIVNNWSDNPLPASGTVSLRGGSWTPFAIEHYTSGSDEQLIIEWESSSTSRAEIPPARMSWSIGGGSHISTIYAPIDSPIFTGDPQAPTPVTSDNDNSIATTEFVYNVISSSSNSPNGPAGGDLAGTFPSPTVKQTSMPDGFKVRWFKDSTLSTKYAEIFGKKEFSETFLTNPLPNYSQVPGITSDTPTWDNTNHYIVGGGGLPNGVQYYYLSTGNGPVTADVDLTIKADYAYDVNQAPKILLYDSDSGWFLDGGLGYGLFSGNVWVQYEVYDETGTIQQSDQQDVNGFTAPTTSSFYWTRLTKTGNVIRIRLYTTDPALGGTAITDTNLTLTGSGATNLGTGRVLITGWSLGGGNRLADFGESFEPESGGPTLRIALIDDDGNSLEKILLNAEGTTELLPYAQSLDLDRLTASGVADSTTFLRGDNSWISPHVHSINTQTTNYTLVLGDIGKLIQMNSGSGLTLTIPLNSSVSFPIGTKIYIEQHGAGTVTVGGSATLRSRGSLLNTNGQYAVITIQKIGTDEWLVYGDRA